MDAEKKSGREFETRRSKLLMRRLMMGLRARMDDELRVKKITTAQLGFLHEVKKNPGGSGAQMARACYVTPQSGQAMMARAVKHGWVVRGKDAENHRLVTARLTPAGERLLEYAHAVYERLEAEVWAGVPLGDLRVMNQVLTRGLKNLEG
jgi:DNA-binding MarR family transcriptional regulator